MNHLYYGDNLDVLRESVESRSIDLVYLDPPFNSARNYNVIFADRSGHDSPAQIEAFTDTWSWSQESERHYDEVLKGGGAPARVGEALYAMRRLLGDGDLLAYLVMMTVRLVELHRVLTPSGSLWLHCDPTASAYLKILLDAIFGPARFRNEVIWRRTPFSGSSKSKAQQLPRSHDVLLFYTKGDSWTWNMPTQPYTEDYVKRFSQEDEHGRFQSVSLKTYSEATLERLRRTDRLIEPRRAGAGFRYKQYLHESSGVRQHDDVWTDINMINPVANERLGYPTQKPEALLERVVSASTDEGNVVLDPFCGCGTTVAVAQRLRRAWVGIDVTFLAVDLIDKRLVDSYGEAVRDTYEVRGIPRDVGAARALFDRSPFEFERWAVSLVEGQPNEKQVGDRGVDGVVRFTLDESDAVGRALVSVKGGGRLNPAMVRDLVGTVESQGDQMGVLVTMEPPTKGMVEAAGRSGTFVWEVTGRRFPRVQVVTVPDLLSGVRPDLPPTYLPYVKARRQQLGQQGRLGL